MSPVLFKLGPVVIYSYGTLRAIGILVAMYLTERISTREGIDPRITIKAFLIGVLSNIIGGRLFYVMQFWEKFSGNYSNIFKVWHGGQVLYGGMICSALALIWYFRKNKINPIEMGDRMAPCISIGIGIGRIGCLLYGCCWGKIAHVPWAVTYPRQMDMQGHIVGSSPYLQHLKEGFVEKSDLHSCPCHPIQIYTTIVLVLFGIMLLILRKKGYFKGMYFWIFLGGYGIIRFIHEFFRGDNEPVLSFMTISQVISIIMFVIAIGGICYYRYRVHLKTDTIQGENICKKY